MASWQWFGRIHSAAYRATRGWLGGRLAGRDMLLVTYNPPYATYAARTTRPLPVVVLTTTF